MFSNVLEIIAVAIFRVNVRLGSPYKDLWRWRSLFPETWVICNCSHENQRTRRGIKRL